MRTFRFFAQGGLQFLTNNLMPDATSVPRKADTMSVSLCYRFIGARLDEKTMTDNEATLLEIKFPRIASAITLLWGNPEMDVYFNRMVIDNRGDREGFPPEVMSDILFLISLHNYAFPFGAKNEQYANGGMRLSSGIGFR
jgi:hypothetical protein